MPEVPPGMKAVLYSDKVRLGMPSTFAAPLRPGARSLPRAVEARFQGRVVFTVVVPIENFPSYTGDWIFWYAERAQNPSPAPGAVKAPIPYRKLEPVAQPALVGKNEARIQIAAVVAKSGSVDSVLVLSTTSEAMGRAAVQDLMSWQFTPANRNGAPIDVDVVIEMPFNLAIARQ
jgi:TonB family protein